MKAALDLRELRDRAITSLAGTELKPEEIASRMVTDFDEARSRIRLIGWGRPDLTWIALPTSAVAAIRKYLEARDAARHEPLFARVDGDGRLRTDIISVRSVLVLARRRRAGTDRGKP